MGDDGGGGESLQRGASSRGGNGPTAAYHYPPTQSVSRVGNFFFFFLRTYVATFLALPSVQRVPVPSPTDDLIERERHAGVRHWVNLELRVDRRRRTAAARASSVPRNWGGSSGRRRGHRRYVTPGALGRRRRVRRCRGVLGRRWARALLADTFALRRRGGVPEGKRCEGKRPAVKSVRSHAWSGKTCLESPPAFVTCPP